MRAVVLPATAAGLACALACGGGTLAVDTSTDAVIEAPATDEGSILLTGVDMGSATCTAKSGDNCAEPATTFAPDTEVIYFVHHTTDIPTRGQTYNIKWIAVDVGDAAPANTVVFDLDKEVTDALMTKIASHFTVESEASKPTAGWPPGSYEIVVTLDGSPVTTHAYTIE